VRNKNARLNICIKTTGENKRRILCERKISYQSETNANCVSASIKHFRISFHALHIAEFGISQFVTHLHDELLEGCRPTVKLSLCYCQGIYDCMDCRCYLYCTPWQ